MDVSAERCAKLIRLAPNSPRTFRSRPCRSDANGLGRTHGQSPNYGGRTLGPVPAQTASNVRWLCCKLVERNGRKGSMIVFDEKHDGIDRSGRSGTAPASGEPE